MPVGADARKKSTWAPVIEKIRGRLTAWNGNFLSLGGKVVLLKSILYALIYLLSRLWWASLELLNPSLEGSYGVVWKEIGKYIG